MLSQENHPLQQEMHFPLVTLAIHSKAQNNKMTKVKQQFIIVSK